jgi:hypothetical protein
MDGIEYAGIGDERVQGGVLPEVEIARLFQADHVFDSVLSGEGSCSEVEGYRSLCVSMNSSVPYRFADTIPQRCTPRSVLSRWTFRT